MHLHRATASFLVVIGVLTLPGALGAHTARGVVVDLDAIYAAELAILGQDPHDPDSLTRLAAAMAPEGIRAALLRAASAALPTSRTERDGPRFAAWLVQERVAVWIDLGLADAALAELESAPPELHRHVLAGGLPPERRVEGATPAPVELRVRDLRLDLAAAQALAGDLEGSLQRLAELGPEAPPGLDRWTTEAWPRRRWLLSRWLEAERITELPGEPDEDLFELLVDSVGLLSDLDQEDHPLWERLAAELALATGHEEMARYLLGRASMGLDLDSLRFEIEELAPHGGLPGRIREEVDRLAQEIATACDLAVLERAARLPSISWILPPGCDRPSPYDSDGPSTEAGLPSEATLRTLSEEPLDPPWSSTVPHLDPASVAVSLPVGRTPVALLPAGATIYLVALSGDDPDAAWSDQYLLYRSIDGGDSWTGPFPLGMEVRAPYEVVAGSSRNRVTGERLDLELSEEWGFTPRRRRLLLLSMPLGAALGDRDGDGLTDREESRAGTDPRRADSDRDGIDDLYDRLTERVRSGRSDRDTETVVALALEAALAFEAPWGPVSKPSEPPLPAEGTSFLFGAGMPLGALRSPGRVVLIGDTTSEEVFDAISIELLAFDATRTRAVVVCTRGLGWARGSRYRFERSPDGEWKRTATEGREGLLHFTHGHESSNPDSRAP